MSNRNLRTEILSPEEKFDAIRSLKLKLEENFIALGELLSEIKRSKLFRQKGYETFKDFIEAEYCLNGGLAAKLASTFDLFIEEMDIDEASVKEIGFDRLQMIRPYVQKADWETREHWVELAENTPANDLRNRIKELRNQEKEQDKDLKQVLIEQYMEKMLSWFNCSSKELNFKLALFFQDADLESIKKTVKERQRIFEQQIQKSQED